MKKQISSLEKAWKKVDMKKFWQDVIRNISPDIEAYRKARAKSRNALD